MKHPLGMRTMTMRLEGESAEFWWSNGVLNLSIQEDAYLEVDELKRLIRSVQDTNNGNYSVLISLCGGASISLEARLFLKRMEAKSGIRAMAVYANSTNTLLEANFFAGYHKPDFRYKVFGDSTKAKNWLMAN